MASSSWPAHFSRLRQLFWIFTLLTIAYIFWMKSYLSPLTSAEIIRLEIAKTTDIANAIIRDWKNAGKFEQGVQSIYLDYLFIALYTIVIALGCRFVSACTGNEVLTKGGKGFAWLIGIASICDIIENIALTKTLHGEVSRWSVTIAYNMARVKFSIVIVCLLFILTCALYWAIGRLAGEKKGFR
ncbi:MAG TPA: hypothetical protein VE035_09715 [Puia sp.]|nr:hypothetical protein [Puia sp.]